MSEIMNKHGKGSKHDLRVIGFYLMRKDKKYVFTVPELEGICKMTAARIYQILKRNGVSPRRVGVAK